MTFFKLTGPTIRLNQKIKQPIAIAAVAGIFLSTAPASAVELHLVKTYPWPNQMVSFDRPTPLLRNLPDPCNEFKLYRYENGVSKWMLSGTPKLGVISPNTIANEQEAKWLDANCKETLDQGNQK